MPEQLTLTTPVFAAVGVTKFRLWVLDLRKTHPDRPSGIQIIFRETDNGGIFISGGKSIECNYEGSVADTIITNFNTVNLSIKSLERLVTERCQADGKLGPGSISGVP